ncbi:T9SS type A sorting domain-containing protein, partial [candidate division KSB1 bacterium]|nr:T9SS type A sorting domain-containing protein [candidate division KSB1 bacterium]
LSFDGVDDLVEVAHDPSLNVSEQFTIEFWIKTENPTQNWTRVLEKGSWDEYYIGFYGNRARMHGALRTDLGNGYSRMTIPLGPSYSVMQPDQWYHVAATYDINTQQAVIYVNGVLEVTKTAVASPRRLLGDLIIGAVKRPVGEDFYYEGHLDAVLDELRIWNIARTDVEITDLMFVELMGGEEGLVAYYPFDEGSGQVAHDMTGNSNHGRLGLTEEEDSADPTWVEITDRPLGPASLPAKQWVDYAADEGLDFAEALPEEFELHPNFPNPFNAGTTISFTVPMTREGAVEVTVNIYDLRGQLIKQLVRGTFESGTHTYKWDGSAEDGIVATSGVYFYRMVAGDYVETRRMLMLK